MPPPLFGVLMVPTGINNGFVTVVLGYLLAQNGVGVDAIAGLVSLRLLPETWAIACGPLVDATLSGPRWHILSTLTMAILLVVVGVVPLEAGSVALLAPLCLCLGVASIVCSSAISAVLSLTTSLAVRGACAGWRQAGFLGGTGLGGGMGLWLATHGAGPRVAALTLAALSLGCIWPFLIVGVPAPVGRARALTATATALRTLWDVIRSRLGFLAAVAVTLPMGLGAAMNLLSAVATKDWHASATLVAAVTGALFGVATALGCVLAGYLCDLLGRRAVFVGACLGAALGEALMAVCPHTPAFFAAMTLLNALLTGLAYGGVTAVVFERLGPVGAATVGGALSSLANLPLVVVTMLLGSTQAHHGSDAMLLVEAALGVASVIVFGILAWVLRVGTAVAAPLAMPKSV
jgi:MFS family permease